MQQTKGSKRYSEIEEVRKTKRMRSTVREICTITLESNEETEVETMATCSDDPSNDDVQVLEDKLMTARANKGYDRQYYNTPKVQDPTRRNYRTLCMEQRQAVLGKERRRKSTEGSMAKKSVPGEVTLVDSDKDSTEVCISSIGNKA